MTKKLECVICGEEAEYLANARYKTGTIKEPLCKTHAEINQQIESEKWNSGK